MGRMAHIVPIKQRDKKYEGMLKFSRLNRVPKITANAQITDFAFVSTSLLDEDLINACLWVYCADPALQHILCVNNWYPCDKVDLRSLPLERNVAQV